VAYIGARDKGATAPRDLTRVSATTALGLSSLGPGFLLHADEAEPATMFPDNTGPLNSLVETPEQLVEALGISNLYPHSLSTSTVLSHMMRSAGAHAK
jgi:hypothetical protein